VSKGLGEDVHGIALSLQSNRHMTSARRRRSASQFAYGSNRHPDRRLSVEEDVFLFRERIVSGPEHRDGPDSRGYNEMSWVPAASAPTDSVERGRTGQHFPCSPINGGSRQWAISGGRTMVGAGRVVMCRDGAGLSHMRDVHATPRPLRQQSSVSVGSIGLSDSVVALVPGTTGPSAWGNPRASIGPGVSVAISRGSPPISP
jgi:hypothetical protein